MTWAEFVKQWRAVVLTRLGIPHRTVYDWRAGKNEPRDWHRQAAEFWISAMAGPPGKAVAKRARKRGRGDAAGEGAAGGDAGE